VGAVHFNFQYCQFSYSPHLLEWSNEHMLSAVTTSA